MIHNHIGLLNSGLYARLLTDLPYDPFELEPPQNRLRDLAAERKRNMMYRPSDKYMNQPDWPVETVGEAFLLDVAATYPKTVYPKTVGPYADALAAAARRSEMGALAAFTAGIIELDSPAAVSAVAQILEDPSNRWCDDPDDFCRKIVTLRVSAYLHDATTDPPNGQISDFELSTASKKLDAALKVVVGEPGQPVTNAETECTRTLLIERGRLIEDEPPTDTPEGPYQPSALLTYSTLSRMQQLACAHHANSALAIPAASKKLAARMGDYARWGAAYKDKHKAGRLTAALLTVPDLPPKMVAGLFVLLQKTLEHAAER